MKMFQFDGLDITLEKEGARTFSKVSYPIRYGRFSEIRTPAHTFQCTLNGEIRYILGKNNLWPHPNEWFKRTLSNDWIYYSTGGYEGVYSLMGEFYLPCLSYPSNPIITTYSFEKELLEKALCAWETTIERIQAFRKDDIPEALLTFFESLSANNEHALKRKADKLHSAIQGRMTVLPPDARHVDYDVIPITVADGCLYNCGFCRVKTGQPFSPRTEENVLDQILKLCAIIARDLPNYNAVFLGQHDSLNADPRLIEIAAQKAYEIFEFKKSFMRGSYLFLFGSVDSFLHSQDSLFNRLNRLPFYTYINLGLESVDSETLSILKKPVADKSVYEAFKKMIAVNRQYENIEVTANFVIGDYLPKSHDAALCDLLGNGIDRTYSKGAVYLSPLDKIKNKRAILKRFFEIKNISRLPVFIYLIQRL